METRHSIVVRAKGPSSIGVDEIIVDVTDVNDNAPSFLKTSYVLSVNENNVVNQVLLTVKATDVDSSTNSLIAYTIAAQTPNTENFQIDADGRVSIVKRLDRETASSYSFIVSAHDNGLPRMNSTNKVTVSVILLDVNDHAPVFTKALYQVSFNLGIPFI